jgi:hypothetical protein
MSDTFTPEEQALRDVDWIDEEPPGPRPPGGSHGIVTPIRWSGDEVEALADAAERAGQPLTAYIRQAVLARIAAETPSLPQHATPGEQPRS